MQGVVVVQGASRGIGAALLRYYAERAPWRPRVVATCRDPLAVPARLRALDRVLVTRLDVTDEPSITAAAAATAAFAGAAGVSTLLNVSGTLHDEERGVMPERRVAEVAPDAMAMAFAVNAIGPALVAKHFTPLLAMHAKNGLKRVHLDTENDPDTSCSPSRAMSACVFLSARVGSIGDNASGGWYSYRGSKAALNAFVKGLGIELKSKRVCCVALHPGTVDTDLTRRFAKAAQRYQVQDVDAAAENIAGIAREVSMQQTGTFMDWKRKQIPW